MSAMTVNDMPWFAGAWRRRSIVVPGRGPVEPCEAWWVQTADVFVDIRVARPGHEDNGLPYSQTRAFAGVFEIADGELQWHLALDTGGAVPHTDRAPERGLFMDADDPAMMIEDAPGRFREAWIRHGPTGAAQVVRTDSMIAVSIGDVSGVVWTDGEQTEARLWLPSGETLHVETQQVGPAPIVGP